jgi:hypothetical protein
VAFGLAGCGTAAGASGTGARHAQLSSEIRPVLGTVKGTYELEGGPIGPGGQNPPIQPLNGIITATGRNGHAKAVAKNGHFTMQLRPGTYKLTGWTGAIKEMNGSTVVENGMHCGSATVVVTAHRTAKAALYCYAP